MVMLEDRSSDNVLGSLPGVDSLPDGANTYSDMVRIRHTVKITRRHPAAAGL